MSLSSEERALRREHRSLLDRRRRAQEAEHFDLAGRLGLKARRVIQKARSIHLRRVGTFRPSMLDGHPGNITDACKRVIALAYKFADQRNYVCTVTATTDGAHAPTSNHYPDSPQNDGKHGNAVDLVFATVGQMEEFQHFCVEHTGGDAADFNELFGPAGFYVKDGSTVLAHFPDHGDHDHISPRPSFRR